MGVKTTVVRARIEPETKAEAEKVLARMGLDISTAIRLMLLEVVAQRKLPFPVEEK